MPQLPRRIVADVLAVTALQPGDPVAILVLMESNDAAFHSLGGRQGHDTELLKQPELVKCVPAFDDFPSTNTDEHHSAELSSPARRHESQAVAAMSARAAPASSNNVALGHHIIDVNGDIWKGAAISALLSADMHTPHVTCSDHASAAVLPAGRSVSEELRPTGSLRIAIRSVAPRILAPGAES